MKTRLGTVQMSRGLPQGAPESPVIFTGRPGQELESLTSDVEFGRLRAGCDLLRRRCGSGSSVGCCSGSDGGRSGRKIEGSVGLTVGTEKTHWASHMMDASIVVDGLAEL